MDPLEGGCTVPSSLRHAGGGGSKVQSTPSGQRPMRPLRPGRAASLPPAQQGARQGPSQSERADIRALLTATRPERTGSSGGQAPPAPPLIGRRRERRRAIGTRRHKGAGPRRPRTRRLGE